MFPVASLFQFCDSLRSRCDSNCELGCLLDYRYLLVTVSESRLRFRGYLVSVLLLALLELQQKEIFRYSIATLNILIERSGEVLVSRTESVFCPKNRKNTKMDCRRFLEKTTVSIFFSHFFAET